jgi:hypothetical protein
MTRLPSADDAEGWTERFLKYQALQRAAQRRRDIPAANRHVDKVTEALGVLAASREGRQRLEGLIAHPDPSTRGRAASEVIAWAPERAIPVLAKLLYEPQDPEAVAFEKVGVSLEAQNALAQYFGLPMHDVRELPDRLADMGIDLPEKFARLLKWEF